MRIAQKRIINPVNFLTDLQEGQSFYVTITDPASFQNRLQRIDFTNISIGNQLLPTIIGPITRFNANGGILRRRDLPMETVYRELDVKDWHGNYHTVYVPYKRYVRSPIPAPSIELLVREGINNNPIITSPLLTKRPNSMSIIKHIINLFLEIFGECEILHENLIPTFNVPITRLNWKILPQGRYPWNVFKNNIQPIISNLRENRKRIINRRLEKITSFNPNFVAVGTAGFKGYMIFGFENKDFFILESIYTGNATYVLGENWEEISKLSKDEILNQDLHQERIIHYQNWESEIDRIQN